VFTTRPDTLMGVSFISIAAEHPLALAAAKANAGIAAFIDECRHGGTATAQIETQEKKGVETGYHAIHPVSGERLPVWVANFVLMGYGTGAVMGVPGHDERDWEFASKYDLLIKMVIVSDPVREAILELGRDAASNADPMTAALGGSAALDVVEPAGALDIVSEFERAIVEDGAYTEYGTCVNSGDIDGMEYEQAFEFLADKLARDGTGRRRVNFRLRDWGVSRQRYWGCPIPIIYCEKCGAVPVPEDQLPVLLPEDVAFMGTGSPIKADPNWRKTTCPTCGAAAERETDTFDTFMESSWYYARYACPGAADMVDARARHWLPVDQYIGGIEHAILHLLYFRFFHKLLRDQGLVDSDEPATNLLCQGMVIADTYYREDEHGGKDWINPSEVEIERNARGHAIGAKSKADGLPVQIGGIEKMSKSRNNGVDPQEMVGKYGADTVRLFSMFAAPPEQSLEWSEAGVEGCARFLRRVWKFFEEVFAAGHHKQLPDIAWDRAQADAATIAVRREIHALLKQAVYDYHRTQFNTVVSAAMKMLNQLESLGAGDPPGASEAANRQRDFARREGQKFLLKILNPIAPHIAHALWQRLNHGEELIENLRWPEPDADALRRDSVTLAVQVNGKLRGTIEVAADAPREAIEAAAQAEPNVARYLDGLAVRKVIVVPGKIVNIVAA
ncbi:MAG: leucine--tRNA ligase, partial [Proteobacteria bacterium]|nr:leucine--tRNA ligase [Pseudomonadota bacterium]